jgi:hypothetical protein
MKNLLSLFALTFVSLSLSAQPKPAVRKPISPTVRTPATQSNTAKTTTTPQNKPVAATKPAPQPAPVYQEQATVAPTPSPTKPQTLAASRAAPQPTTPTKESHFQIGFRLGGNSSTIGGVDVSELGPGVKLERVTGFHGGVVFNIGGPTFSVQPEILYTQYGVRMAFNADYLQIKYNLVEVPILLKATFGTSNAQFFVNAGPVATYTLSGTISVREGGQSDSQTMDMTNEGRFSYGASGGAGVSLKAGPGKFLLEGRYSYLFSNSSDETKLKPQNAMLSVGYLIPIGGR